MSISNIFYICIIKSLSKVEVKKEKCIGFIVTISTHSLVMGAVHSGDGNRVHR